MKKIFPNLLLSWGRFYLICPILREHLNLSLNVQIFLLFFPLYIERFFLPILIFRVFLFEFSYQLEKFFCLVHLQISILCKMFHSKFSSLFFYINWEVFCLNFILGVFLLNFSRGLKIFHFEARLSNILCLIELPSKRKDNCNVVRHLTCLIISHMTYTENC